MRFHDLIQQLGYLQQSLAQDKKPLGFFIGAGCPMSIKNKEMNPLIPAIDGVTKLVCSEVSAAAEISSCHLKVVEDLKNIEGNEPNIEKMLGYIRLLKQVVGTGRINGMCAEDLDSYEQRICQCIIETVDKELPNSETPYHMLAKWIGAANRTEPVEVFTTNYDLLMEQAFEECRVPYFDGFVGSRKTFFDLQAIEEDKLPPRWARLWKLHGSINWSLDKDNEGVVFVSRGEPKSTQRSLIHPSHLKYEESRKMPYLAMIDRLWAFLKKPYSVLIVCGYSFGDQHLNDVFFQGLQGNPTAAVFALQFGSINQYKFAINDSIKRANLSLLAEDEAIIGTRRAHWISKDIASENNNSDYVEWISQPECETKKVCFKLGDFNFLGKFLQELTGANEKVQ